MSDLARDTRRYGLLRPAVAALFAAYALYALRFALLFGMTVEVLSMAAGAALMVAGFFIRLQGLVLLGAIYTVVWEGLCVSYRLLNGGVIWEVCPAFIIILLSCMLILCLAVKRHALVFGVIGAGTAAAYMLAALLVEEADRYVLLFLSSCRLYRVPVLACAVVTAGLALQGDAWPLWRRSSPEVSGRAWELSAGMLISVIFQPALYAAIEMLPMLRIWSFAPIAMRNIRIIASVPGTALTAAGLLSGRRRLAVVGALVWMLSSAVGAVGTALGCSFYPGMYEGAVAVAYFAAYAVSLLLLAIAAARPALWPGLLSALSALAALGLSVASNVALHGGDYSSFSLTLNAENITELLLLAAAAYILCRVPGEEKSVLQNRADVI